MQKPSVYDYLDVAQYLSDYLQWRKFLEPGFSISKWASEMNFQSKVTLRFILKKLRRISPDTMRTLQNYLKLNKDEAGYFENLIAYSQAKTAAEKQAVGTILIKLQRGQFRQTMLPSETAGRNEFTPVILALLTFDDFEKTTTNIARLLVLDEESTEKILSDLVSDGLITLKSDKTYYFSEKTFRVAGSPDLKGFYEYWIDRSKAALDLPYELRRYRALKFALTPEEFKDVIEKLNEYSMLLLSKYQSSSLQGRRLYMYESAVFPISKSLDVLQKSPDEDLQNLG